MKKGLSILLIAAALFGFYGGAVNLNDVLACKDYWEKAGEESTANMNKLEDGLNQLKENEQAYLDGKDQVAEGEQTLVEGEKTLADGEAQYEQGLADYKAAPAKLADGEAQLAAGEDSYSQLKTLIAGLKKAQKHGAQSTKNHDTYWHDAFTNALAPGRKQITSLLGSNAPMIGTLAGDNTVGKNLNDKASYPNFDKDVQKLVKDIPTASSKLKGYAKTASDYANNTDLKTAAAALKMGDDGYKAYVTQQVVDRLNGSPEAKAGLSQATGGAITEYSEAIVKKIADSSDPLHGLYNASDKIKEAIDKYSNAQTYGLAGVRATVAAQIKGSELYQMKDMLSDLAASNPDLARLIKAMDALAANSSAQPDSFGPDEKGNAGYSETITGFQSGLATLAATLNGLAKQLDDGLADLKKWDAGYQTLSHAKDDKTSKAYPDDLASKSSGIPFAFKNMVTNPTIKNAIKAYDKGLMKILKKYTGDRLKNDSMEEFDDDIVYLSKKVIPRALKVLAHVKKDAEKQLADGRAQLAQGRADYAAAPGKLADAEKQLADGRKALEDGRKQLEDGKAQLAQYEDGEQQVRDGLDTLTGTEADLDLVSILDRLNGDNDFDNGDEHLDLDEGLAAVEVGRGYQAEDGVLITKEIMARAVGTGALLGAGVLAVLAAILSFLKKNKGAGVFAILTAAAAAFGAYYGTNAGTYFSDIAGSTAGNTGWVAAGIIGVIALAHAIAHFTAKKEA